MNQRTTGLVAGLVTFAILTVALVATTIYFFVEAGSAMEKKKAADDAAKNRGEALTRMEGNYRALVNFMTGDAEAAAGEDTLANVKKALAAL